MVMIVWHSIYTVVTNQNNVAHVMYNPMTMCA
jgi:hypothetical protein